MANDHFTASGFIPDNPLDLIRAMTTHSPFAKEGAWLNFLIDYPGLLSVK